MIVAFQATGIPEWLDSRAITELLALIEHNPLLIGLGVVFVAWLALKHDVFGIPARRREVQRARIFDTYEKVNSARAMEKLSAEERERMEGLLWRFGEDRERYAASVASERPRPRRDRRLARVEAVLDGIGEFIGVTFMFCFAFGVFYMAVMLLQELVEDGFDLGHLLVFLGMTWLGACISIGILRKLIERGGEADREDTPLATFEFWLAAGPAAVLYVGIYGAAAAALLFCPWWLLTTENPSTEDVVIAIVVILVSLFAVAKGYIQLRRFLAAR